MSEVEDVPGPSGLVEDFLSHGNDAFLWSKQHARIQIPLKRNSLGGAAASLFYRDSPIDANDVRPRRGNRFEY